MDDSRTLTAATTRKSQYMGDEIPLVGELLENEDSHMRVAVYKLQKVTEFW